MPLVISIDLSPNLVSLGSFLITWHGVFSVLGILAATRLGAWLLSRDGMPIEKVYDMAVWMVVIGLLGARLLFVWENYRQFQGQWIHVLYLTEGGISQWGGIFGGLLGGYLYCRRNQFSYLKVLDAVGPANALGFAIGRIGDIINGEHHAIASNLPWAVNYINEHTLGTPGKPVHPEVAYEMLFNLLTLALLLPLFSRFKRGLPDGATGLIWLAIYSVGRFLLSFLREDSLLFGLRQAQWASVLMVVAAAVMVPYLLSRRRRTPQHPEAVAA